MDPLSITTACVALLGAAGKTSLAIATFIRGCRDARADLTSISGELTQLKLVLELLKDDTDVSNDRVLPESLQNQILAIVKNCSDVLDSINTLLQKHAGKAGAAKWVISGKAEVIGLRMSLEAHRWSLSLVLELVSVFLSKAIKEDMTAVRNDVHDIKQDTNQIPQIMAELTRLRAIVAAGDILSATRGQNYVLEQYLDSLTSYAETVCSEVVWDSDESLNVPSPGPSPKISPKPSPTPGCENLDRSEGFMLTEPQPAGASAQPSTRPSDEHDDPWQPSPAIDPVPVSAQETGSSNSTTGKASSIITRSVSAVQLPSPRVDGSGSNVPSGGEDESHSLSASQASSPLLKPMRILFGASESPDASQASRDHALPIPDFSLLPNLAQAGPLKSDTERQRSVSAGSNSAHGNDDSGALLPSRTVLSSERRMMMNYMATTDSLTARQRPGVDLGNIENFPGTWTDTSRAAGSSHGNDSALLAAIGQLGTEKSPTAPKMGIPLVQLEEPLVSGPAARAVTPPATTQSQPSSPSVGGVGIRRKLLIVGDNVGKTALLRVFSKGTFPEAHAPTIFNNYVADVEVDQIHVELALWDTSGMDGSERTRSIAYPDTHVIMICFGIDSPDSLDNVQEKWIYEVRRFCPTVRYILVGLRKDLRDDPRILKVLEKTSQRPVTWEEGYAISDKIGACGYYETSALANEGVKKAFTAAIRLALNYHASDEEEA